MHQRPVLALSGCSSVTCWTVKPCGNSLSQFRALSGISLLCIGLIKLTALYSTSKWAVYAGPQKGSALCFFRANSKNPRVSSMIVAVKPPCTMVGKPQTSLQQEKQCGHGQCLQMRGLSWDKERHVVLVQMQVLGRPVKLQEVWLYLPSCRTV